MDKKTEKEYIMLFRKLCLDENFKKWVMLHHLRSSIANIDPWTKLITEIEYIK